MSVISYEIGEVINTIYDESEVQTNVIEHDDGSPTIILTIKDGNYETDFYFFDENDKIQITQTVDKNLQVFSCWLEKLGEFLVLVNLVDNPAFDEAPYTMITLDDYADIMGHISEQDKLTAEEIMDVASMVLNNMKNNA